MSPRGPIPTIPITTITPSTNLTEEFPAMDAKQTQTGIMFFLSAWFEVQMSDFLEGPMAQKLEDFIKQMPAAFSRPIKSKINSVILNKATPTLYLFKPSASVHKSPLSLGKFGLLDMKPEQVADQWTLLDMREFLQIKPSEFLLPGEHWNSMLQRSTTLSRWVASEIVQVTTASRRAEVVERFLEIALRFLENKNFNGLMSVWGGLNSLFVHRLTKTHKKISRKHSDIRDALSLKLSEEYNFFQLRKAMDKMRKNKEPVVPWFELINKFRNWSDQYPDYVDASGDIENVVDCLDAAPLHEDETSFRASKTMTSSGPPSTPPSNTKLTATISLTSSTPSTASPRRQTRLSSATSRFSPRSSPRDRLQPSNVAQPANQATSSNSSPRVSPPVSPRSKSPRSHSSPHTKSSPRKRSSPRSKSSVHPTGNTPRAENSPRIKTSKKFHKKSSQDSPSSSRRKSVSQGSSTPTPEIKPEEIPKQENELLYINFGKVTLMGEQIITLLDYQNNLTPIQLNDPELDNQVDSAIRMFLSHLPTYDDEILWKFSNTCQQAEVV